MSYDFWVYTIVCVVALAILLMIPSVRNFISYLDEIFWMYALGIVLVAFIAYAVYDSYKVSIWMEQNHCQQTLQSRDYLYYISVQTGSTTILVPQTGTEYLYTCDNNQTIWWSGE